MNKIAALNELEVVDYSCSGGECEYVSAENNEENRNKLIGSGFTKEQIKEANDGNDLEIDLAVLAFNYTVANCWHVKGGFSYDTNFEA